MVPTIVGVLCSAHPAGHGLHQGHAWVNIYFIKYATKYTTEMQPNFPAVTKSSLWTCTKTRNTRIAVYIFSSWKTTLYLSEIVLKSKCMQMA